MSIEDLGRRATACKHWRWMGGMAAIDRPLWRIVERAGLPPYMVNGYMEESLDGVLPDLSDPATLGCLLYLVREAWGAERASAWWCGPLRAWAADVRIIDSGRVFHGDTEAEALVIALEAAP